MGHNLQELLAKYRSKQYLSQQELLFLRKAQLQEGRNNFASYCKQITPNFKYEWWQEYIMSELNEIFQSPKGGRLRLRVADQHGKGLVHGTPVKTINGWNNIENIKIDDIIDSGLGYYTQVIGVYPQGEKEIYRFTFIDGRYIDCDIDHLWEIHCTEFSKEKIKILNTKEILQLHNKKTFYKNLCIPYYEPVKSKISSNLLLTPYLLGVLIGDGNLGKIIRLSSADDFIINKCNTLLELYNCKLHKINKYDYSINKIIKCGKLPNKINFIIKQLKLNNTHSYNKFIPIEYINADYSSRLKLIQGLMDTDGSIGKQSTIEYCTTSSQLALDMQYLIRSIGGLCTIKTTVKSFIYKGEKKQGKLCYRLNIRHRDQTLLFSLPRKLERCKSYHRRSNAKLAIWDIQSLGKKQSTCIKVDNERGLFTTKDFIVTHNTHLGGICAASYLLGKFPNSRGLYLTFSDERAKTPCAEILDVLTSPEYKSIFPEFRLADEMESGIRLAKRRREKLGVLHFTNANSPDDGHKGSFTGSGITSGSVGYSYEWIICDDLLNGITESLSATIRENRWNIFKDNILTRLPNNAIVILFSTWWHPDDILGRLDTCLTEARKQGKSFVDWKNIIFNAQKDERDYPYDHRQIGEYLAPERKMDYYNDMQVLSPLMWQIKCQNIVTDFSKKLFNADDFQWYYTPPKCSMEIITVDPNNGKQGKKTDDCAVNVIGLAKPKIYLLETLSLNMIDVIEQAKQIAELTNRHPNYSFVLIEDSANGNSLATILTREYMIKVVMFNPRTKNSTINEKLSLGIMGKYERAYNVQPYFKHGQVYFPHSSINPKINKVFKQFINFTGEDYAGSDDNFKDDHVDSIVQAIIKLEKFIRAIPQTRLDYKIPIVLPKIGNNNIQLRSINSILKSHNRRR